MLLLSAFAAAAFLATWIAVGFLRHWMTDRRLLDFPNERSSHSQPTPRGGGLGIVGVALSLFVTFALVRGEARTLPFLSYILGAVLLALVSWRDDIRSLPASLRLAVHGTSAALAIAGIGAWRVLTLGGYGELSLGLVGVAVTMLWIVGLANAYNFMDGIDGLAAVQAIIAGSVWAFLGSQGEVPMVAILGVLIAAGAAGFMVHNWSPARIFMGDVGSIFLGYTIALFPLLFTSLGGRESACPWGAPLTGLLVVWPFAFDTAFTFFRRLIHGENIFSAHRSHLYQRLVAAGYRHSSVSLGYAALSILGSAAALLPSGWGLRWFAPVFIPFMAAALWSVVVLSEVRSSR